MKTILIVRVNESAGHNLHMHRYIAQSQQADATGGTHVLLVIPVELVHQMFVLWHCWCLKSDDHEFTGRYTLEDERLEATNHPSLKDFFFWTKHPGNYVPKGSKRWIFRSVHVHDFPMDLRLNGGDVGVVPGWVRWHPQAAAILAMLRMQQLSQQHSLLQQQVQQRQQQLECPN